MLHIIDKNLIVEGGKLKIKSVINSTVVTEDNRKIGKVYDVFGHVKRPYAGIKVFSRLKEEELKKLLHKKLYVLG